MTKYSIKEFNDAYETFHEIIEKWIINGIESTFKATSNESQTKGSPLVAYLLLSSAIDILAGFYSGRNPKKSGKVGEQYKSFVKRYMKNYSPVILYKDLRCNLTHNFILGTGLGLTFINPELHNQRDSNGRIIKNFTNLFYDFKEAFKEYSDDIYRDQILKNKFMKRFKEGGILALNLENIGGVGKNSPVLTNYRQKERI